MGAFNKRTQPAAESNSLSQGCIYVLYTFELQNERINTHNTFFLCSAQRLARKEKVNKLSILSRFQTKEDELYRRRFSSQIPTQLIFLFIFKKKDSLYSPSAHTYETKKKKDNANRLYYLAKQVHTHTGITYDESSVWNVNSIGSNR